MTKFHESLTFLPDGRIFATTHSTDRASHHPECNAAAYGPVRCLYVNARKTRLWDTAGDDEDLGTVFYYDDMVGLRQLGFLIYTIHGYFDGPSASNILSSIAVSRDEALVAVGGADRIGAIRIADLR